MTTPSLYNPREATQIHLEIVEEIIETIRDTFPAAATLDCHRQMRDILTRVKNTLDHPILFAAHIIVYLVKAVRYSRRWATLVKNIAALDPLLLKRHSSDPSSPSSVLSPQHSVLSSPPSVLSSESSALSTQHSVLSPHHSVETRLRIQAFAQALQHERRLAQKLPLSVPKPDLTPILTAPRHSSISSPQSPIRNPRSPLLSLKPKAYSLQPTPPLFPSESLWASKVQNLQLRILTNITRALDYISVAYLRQYDFPISSIPSIPSIFPGLKAQDSSLKTQTSSPLTPHPSALIPHPSALSLQPPGPNLETPP